MTRRQQEFLAPGTWICPPTVTEVEVFLVGGGSGGRLLPNYTGGSGGGVRTATVPVSGPVPVTVGAGGTAETPPAPAPVRETPGGTTSFGSTQVGGGGSPPVPGYFGGAPSSNDAAPQVFAFGQASIAPAPVVGGGGGGAGFSALAIPIGSPTSPGWATMGGSGINGFGAGGTWGSPNPTPSAPLSTRGFYYGVGVANTGAGGVYTAGAGQSGYVIVRWFE